MANVEQLEILKQGVEVWNKWRNDKFFGLIDLSQADLREADLNGVNLRRANLRGVDFRIANLREANLSETDLREANFREAKLTRVDLVGANLRGCDFLNTVMDGIVFENSDLSEVLGLEHAVHLGPSLISIKILALSKGKIPKVFLQGCGLSDTDIEYAKLYDPELSNDEKTKIVYEIYDLSANQAIQISPLFISYSHDDGSFVDKLEKHLNKKGVRFWRDVHSAVAGRLEKQIDRALRLNPTVILILSKNSTKSDWVEHEVRTARELEKELRRDVLCPVALDDSWKNSPWPKRVVEQVMEYNILDFSAWEEDGKFGNTFKKLIDGLGLFY